MMQIVAVRILPAAYDLLPSECASTAATRTLLAIGYQESGFRDRVQRLKGGRRGPAHSLWQCERGGAVAEVLVNRSTARHMQSALKQLGYDPTADAASVWAWIEHNDVLAAVVARLNLWRSPRALPATEGEAWAEYVRVWAPGKPRPETWAEAWERASALV